MNPQDQLEAFLAQRQQNENFDTSETIHLNALSFLKMLKHSSSDKPKEIIGILLGNFIDDYTINVSDVFGTPQTGDNLTSEPFEDDFQIKMKELLSQTGHEESIVGWYQSHTGTGLWLSAVAVNTQMSQQKNNPRSFVMVVNTNQSVKEHVSISAFRCIDHVSAAQGEEPRETTSFEGSLDKPTTKQLVRGLNRQYYKLLVRYRMQDYEQRMLECLHKKTWYSFLLPNITFKQNDKISLDSINKLIQNADEYKRQILEEEGMSFEDRMKRNIGKVDPCTFIKQETDRITVGQINQLFITEVNSITF